MFCTAEIKKNKVNTVDCRSEQTYQNILKSERKKIKCKYRKSKE